MTQLPETDRFIHRVHPTPLVRVVLEEGDPGIWCKLEFLNPSGSTKDRIARYMLEKACRQGRLGRGGEVVEASSGSTSIALALVSAQLGLRFTAVMPEGVSDERLLIIRAFGGNVILTPREEGMRGALARAEAFSEEKGAFYTRQFENPDNVESHRLWTGQEILSQIPGGTVHGLVSGVGTAGTIVGLHQAFTDAGCSAVPFAARPIQGTAVSDLECCSFSTRVPGVVEGISKLYEEAELPGLVELNIADAQALSTTRRLMGRGFPVGPSSGLNYAAALQAAQRLGPEAQVVTVFPDRMERYFSTELFRGR